MTSEHIKIQSTIEQHQQNPQQDTNRAGAGALRKTGGAVSRFIGYEKLTKNINILKHRASMPLLRKIFTGEFENQKAKPFVVSASELSEDVIQRSLFWHTFIIIFSAPALAWSILILTKALAIGIRFETWSPFYNQGLYTSVPIILFTSSKLYVSWHSRKAFKEHIKQSRKGALHE